MQAHIFHIQALFLVEAIAMFNAGAQAPVVINRLGYSHAGQGDVRFDQNQLPVEGDVIGYQNP